MNLEKFKKSIRPYYMSILSVFISVLSFTMVSLISTAGKNAISKELDGIGMNGMSVTVHNSTGDNITSAQLYATLEQNNGIKRITPVIFQNTTINFNTGKELTTMCWGIAPTTNDVVNLKQICGRNFTQQDIDSKNMVCLVDENVALNTYGRKNITGKKLFISTPSGVFRFEIIGTVNKTSNILNSMSGKSIPDFIYIPYTVMQSIFNRQGIDQIILNVADETIDENSIKDYIISKKIIPNDSVLEITNLTQQRENISKIVDIAFISLFAVSCVAVIVCGISVATSAAALVNNSKHDIGIKISLGASVPDIMSEFMLYSRIACIIGIIFGLSAGYIVMYVINLILSSDFSFDMQLITYGVSATIILAMVFSLYPCYKAAHLLPVKALSRE